MARWLHLKATKNRARSAHCKCCDSVAKVFGTVDFAKTCMDRERKVFADSESPVRYFRCFSCGFIFTTFFDDWSPERWRREIYNEDYLLADPEFTGLRSSQNAREMQSLFGGLQGRLSILDYGGGNGELARELKKAGFLASATYDPFHSDTGPPDNKFDLVTSFEVMEHSTEPLKTFRDAFRFVADGGILYFSTLLQPPNIERIGLEWWYASPRNGHVSLYTPRALREIAARLQCEVISFTEGCHAMYRADSGSDLLGKLLKKRTREAMATASRYGLSGYAIMAVRLAQRRCWSALNPKFLARSIVFSIAPNASEWKSTLSAAMRLNTTVGAQQK